MSRRMLPGGAAGFISFPTLVLSLSLTLVSILTLALPAQGEEPFKANFEPTLVITRTNGPIQIDGDLDDAGWKNAAIADHFVETSPGDLTKPPVRSEAWVTYDQQNLYVALIAYDDPGEVRVSLRDRDNIYRDDYFGIMLDTYGESSWGYELFVNPLGIQGDLRMEGTGGEDGSFDIIWESIGRVTETGYQVEIAIPFASLRFPNREEHTWRINFWRDRQRDNRNRYSWAAISRDNPCLMCQFGYLTGIEGVQTGKNLDVIASVIGTQVGELDDRDDPRSNFSNDDPKGEASLNMRYALTSNSSAELAINPDFSQVESDAGQIDVNRTYALFFEERRPFFQEGSDLFNTWISAVYTRSINNPDVAGKLLGEFGNTSVVYLFGHDDASPLIIPFEERSELLLLDESYTNIVRMRTNLREESAVGLLVTDRRVTG
ncbi:MAG: carbohydrate binding family 9 domain-containing protein, partial [Gemmatimonadetes bacterium]|nr:carbohydrate binding family 9 domain-containing protein [Gemmatimonadota bacterium]